MVALSHLIFLIITVTGIYGYPQQDGILEQINLGTKQLQHSDVIPQSLTESVQKIKNITDAKQKSEMVCRACEMVAGNVISLRKSLADRDTMIDYLKKLCNVYTDFGPIACEGYVNLDVDTVLFVIDYRANFTPARFCSIRLQEYQCIDPQAEPWVIPLPPPSQLASESATSNKTTDSKPLNILHLTDIHYDALYKHGSDAQCKEPLCCEEGTPSKPENAAGYWGDYNCDTPLEAIEDLLKRINDKHKNIDLIYFTGDIVSHKSWATSIQSNRESIRLILQFFNKSFPNITIFPILGNHESHPSDYFSPLNALFTNVTTEWIFDLAADEWIKWLPIETQSTIINGGYYTVLVKPGFRVVALNSNVCFSSNLWLLYDDKDPFNQLLWLVKVLAQAEQNNEKVHLLSHIPPGELTCHKQWSNQFAKIVKRFSKTIVAHFNGHTHTDEFRLFIEDDQVINIAFNGASFTTFKTFNPNYRMYEVDNNSLVVSDYDQYIYDLKQANKNSGTPPQWYKLYSFKDAYGLKDLSFPSLKSLYDKMTSNGSNNALVEQYYKYAGKMSEVYLSVPCDIKCKKQMICFISSVEANTSFNC